VDAAEAMIAVAQKKAGARPGLAFAAALAEELPYPDGSFDRVLSTFFFHHLNYGLKVKALAEIWRVLRPGGQAAILDVDVPYSFFGKLCAWSGFWLFHQAEIAENIRGKLREALDASPWRGHWQIASRHSGYLSLLQWSNPRKNNHENQTPRPPRVLRPALRRFGPGPAPDDPVGKAVAAYFDRTFANLKAVADKQPTKDTFRDAMKPLEDATDGFFGGSFIDTDFVIREVYYPRDFLARGFDLKKVKQLDYFWISCARTLPRSSASPATAASSSRASSPCAIPC
jgi:SAM-dependent methyltransferase